MLFGMHRTLRPSRVKRTQPQAAESPAFRRLGVAAAERASGRNASALRRSARQCHVQAFPIRTANIESIIMAHIPPIPPAGRAPQGSKSTSGKTNPKDAKAYNGAGNGKQIGVSKATQSNRNSGNR
jgi:hypothetical protein